MKHLKKYIETFLLEGRYDKYNNKLILFFGSPGTGKSTFIKSLKAKGLKHSTPDDILNLLVKRNYLDTGKADNESSAYEEFGSEIFSNFRGQSLEKATSRLESWKSSPLGIVMEGTGTYPDWYLEEVIIPFQDRGYDIMIVMLYKELDVCIARNNNRSRKLPDNVISSLHEGFLNNYNEFKNIALSKSLDFTTIYIDDQASDDVIPEFIQNDMVGKQEAERQIQKFLDK